MDQALMKIGLPVTCGKCGAKGRVRPNSDYDGWFKSKLFRFSRKKSWYCPEHFQVAKEFEDVFYARYKVNEQAQQEVNLTEELYKLLD